MQEFNIPVFKKIYELYKVFHECLRFFPKQEKYTLGQKIENVILETMELILQAAYSPKNTKSETIRIISRKVDLLKRLFRLAFETKSLNVKKYAVLEEITMETWENGGRMVKIKPRSAVKGAPFETTRERAAMLSFRLSEEL